MRMEMKMEREKRKKEKTERKELRARRQILQATTKTRFTQEEMKASQQSLKTERTTTLMAALAMGGRPRFRSWAPYDDSGSAESRTLEAVALAVDLGVDLNATNANGRSALDEAEARQYESVVIFLVDRGAGNP